SRVSAMGRKVQSPGGNRRKLVHVAMTAANTPTSRSAGLRPERTSQNAKKPAVRASQPRDRLREKFTGLPMKRAGVTQDNVGDFWIPDVLLASLPAGQRQVLAFWASQSPSEESFRGSREEAVRFALYWYLYCWSDNKAASWCFEYIKDNKDA